jgi:hypothetical protein
MTPLHYTTRNHAFAPPTTWVLDGDVLRIEEDQRPVRELRLATIRELRLEFTPSRPEPNRYCCRLAIERGQPVFFYNRTYGGVYDFRDTSADYLAFVHALVAAVYLHAPGCRLVAGSRELSFWLNFALLVGVGIAVVVAFKFFLTAGLLWVVAIKVLLVLFYTPIAIKWVRSNKPRLFTLDRIPPEVLPVPPRGGL